jgi:hypothetical protein
MRWAGYLQNKSYQLLQSLLPSALRAGAVSKMQWPDEQRIEDVSPVPFWSGDAPDNVRC